MTNFIRFILNERKELNKFFKLFYLGSLIKADTDVVSVYFSQIAIKLGELRN